MKRFKNSFIDSVHTSQIKKNVLCVYTGHIVNGYVELKVNLCSKGETTKKSVDF